MMTQSLISRQALVTISFIIGLFVQQINADCSSGFLDGSIISEVGSPALSLTRRALNAVNNAGAWPEGFPGITTGNTFLAPSNDAWVQMASYLDTNVEGLFQEPQVRTTTTVSRTVSWERLKLSVPVFSFSFSYFFFCFGFPPCSCFVLFLLLFEEK